MAYIKVKWRKNESKGKELNAYDYEKYLLKDRGTELVFNAHSCIGGYAVEQFESKQRSFNQFRPASRGGKINLAMEVIHNFEEKESQMLGAEKINQMGMELASRYFPDHQYLVVTHTDTKKIHNHILVNPVNEITGKRDITDKKKHLYNLREISDGMLRERGLSVIKENTVREKIVSEKVRKIQSRGGNSYKLDLFQKADFARTYATSFDEYVSVLHELSIGVAITENNITYFYGDRTKGVRGNKLGYKYDKDGLISKFKENDERFSKRPYLKERIYEGINAFTSTARDSMGVSSTILSNGGNQKSTSKKDYSAYTKSDRGGDRTPLPPSHSVYDSLIPISEIKAAASGSVLDYCLDNKIALKKSDNGDLLLKHREFVKIDDHGWTNLKNGTKGSLIEFVAFHEDITFLKAISQITGNKNLLLLEQHYGEVKRPYKSFYIPKEREADKASSNLKLRSFLMNNGIKSDHADDLFKQKRVQVDKKGSIWLFSEGSQFQANEYQFDEKTRGYKRKEHGEKDSFFYNSYQSGGSLRVFTNPLSFLRQKGSGQLNKSKSELVLMGLNKKAMHIFLAHHPRVNSIELIDSQESRNCPSHDKFFKSLKKELRLFDIQIVRKTYEKSISKDLSHGIEL